MAKALENENRMYNSSCTILKAKSQIPFGASISQYIFYPFTSSSQTLSLENDEKSHNRAAACNIGSSWHGVYYNYRNTSLRCYPCDLPSFGWNVQSLRIRNQGIRECKYFTFLKSCSIFYRMYSALLFEDRMWVTVWVVYAYELMIQDSLEDWISYTFGKGSVLKSFRDIASVWHEKIK